MLEAALATRQSVSQLEIDGLKWELSEAERAVQYWKAKAGRPVAPELTDEQGIRGPLTAAQKNHAHCLYRTLNHLGPDAAEDVIRYASVCGYVNGRKDFEVDAAAPPQPINHTGDAK